MKNTKVHTTILFFILMSCMNINAQDISGSITYKGVVNEKFVDSFLVAVQKEKMPMSVKQDIIYALKNAKKEEFTLNFKKDESYYYKEPTLDEENNLMGSRAGATPYYIDLSNNMIVQLSSALGNINRESVKWEITNQTKKIGNYICRQAIAREKLFSRQGYYYYKNVVAWFTPEIPVSFGPKNYTGLPGLILQIEDKEYTLTAVKINLNPKENLEIKKVDDDKVISEEESHNRIKEMMSDREKMYKN